MAKKIPGLEYYIIYSDPDGKTKIAFSEGLLEFLRIKPKFWNNSRDNDATIKTFIHPLNLSSSSGCCLRKNRRSLSVTMCIKPNMVVHLLQIHGRESALLLSAMG